MDQELVSLDFAVLKDGGRVMLYRIDRGAFANPIFRVWTRVGDRRYDHSNEAAARARFENIVSLSGGRI